ncbi:MAG: TIM-barrel domain-containing protein [Chthoniobacteraceae bacterium]
MYSRLFFRHGSSCPGLFVRAAQFAIIGVLIGSPSAHAAAKIIPLKGGNAGQGFSPLPFNAGSIKIGGGEATVQGIDFAADDGRGINPGGSFSAGSITPSSLGFSGNPTQDDINLATLLQSFRYVNRAPFDFTNPDASAQYRFTGLKPGKEYQLDLFTVADANPRKTSMQAAGASVAQDIVLTDTAPEIVEYTLKPDASGAIVVRYGFGGGPGDSGLLSAIAITTDSPVQQPRISIDAATRTITVTTAHNTVRLQPWSHGTIRVQAAPGDSIPPKHSFAVIAQPNPAGWTISDQQRSIMISGPRLKAAVDKYTGLVTFYSSNGQPLLTQSGWRFDSAANPARDGLQIHASFARQSGEHFFGGGVIGDNLRQPSTDIDLQNDYLQMHIPILYSSLGYGFFWDNSSRGHLRTTPDSVSWESSAGDLADFYVMAGPQADNVIAEYRHLTGAAPMFPLWAYGFWFSRNAFSHQQEIIDAGAKFRQEQLPIDLLVQDFYYWKPDQSEDGGTDWGSHHFDPVRYPDPKGMIDTLHNQDHIHFMAVIWAKFDPDIAHAQELDKIGALLPPHGDWASSRLRYYDPFNPAARKIYGRQVMESLLSIGQDAFWMDGAEPEMDMDTLASFHTAAGPGSRVMDAFPLMHTTSVYTAQRAVTSQKRVVLLPRSSWAGEQRNSACSWTSDIQQSWHDFTWQIQGLQNYSICGLPYITTDVGGYAPTSQSDLELFSRWLEWGAFCPIFRVHGIGRPFPWEYGQEGEAIFKKVDLLRYRLLPYIYSEAARITFHSGTLLRPLVMDFQDDPRAVTQWDEFMFGPSILVCPVYTCSREQVGGPDQFSDKGGSADSVTATYIKSDGTQVAASKELREGLQFRDGAQGDQHGASSIRIEGTYTPTVDGTLDFEVSEPHPEGYPVTGSINGQPTPVNPLNGDWQFPQIPFVAKAGTPVKFSIETKMSDPVFRVVRNLPQPFHRDVYLPGHGGWYDFWTGERLSGGAAISAEAPLDRIPLYVRAGAIIPMGPEVQYAAEQPDAPLELRVYRGANGARTLYRDEDDNYDYEKGAYSEIPISWNDSTNKLTFGARKGSYPGMPAKCTFDIVWVSPGHGNGEALTTKPDSVVSYSGKGLSIQAP